MKRIISGLVVLAMVVGLGSVAEAASDTYMSGATKAQILFGAMNGGDTYKMAFFDVNEPCDETVEVYPAETNLVDGSTFTGYTLGTFSVDDTTTVGWLDDFSNESAANVFTISAQTWTEDARCGIVYNDTHASDQVLFVFTIDAGVQPTGDDVTITFPPDAAGTAIIRVN
jgi:hypothetical protein